MANLTQDRADGRQEGVLIDVPFGSNTIYAGAIVSVDSAGAARTGTSGDIPLGVAMESTAEIALAGRDKIRVWVEGVFDFNIASVAATDLGKAVKIGGDDTSVALHVAGTDAENLKLGKIVETTVTGSTGAKVRVKI